MSLNVAMMRPASRKFPGIDGVSGANVHTDCGTQAPPMPAPHAVLPSDVCCIRATPTTMRYVGIGCAMRNFVMAMLSLPEADFTVRDTRVPLAITLRAAGAVTVQFTVALSLG